MGSEQYVRSYVVKQSDAKGYELEPNHSHFLIFDGESTDLDTLLLQRAKIEEYSCQIDIKTSRKDERIPAVMILLEGGPFSVRTVCQALRSNTPLVVVKVSVAFPTQQNICIYRFLKISNRVLAELQILLLICMDTFPKSKMINMPYR